MKSILIKLICSLMFFANITFGYVLNYGFLNDTAGMYFNDKDWAIYQKYQLRALDNSKDGSKVRWSNPESGSWGSFIPSQSMVKNGIYCRNLTIVNAANFRIGQSTLRFCKINGDWKGV